MRLLANENVPGLTVRRLRERGHDVHWVREDSPGSDDPAVLSRAVEEGRVLLTQDKDFGELAFRSGLPAECGVILSRIPPDSPEFLTETLVAAIEGGSDWVGHFAVVEAGRVRIRALPARTSGSAE